MQQSLAPLDRRSLVALAGLLLLCFAVAAIVSAVTEPRIATWYAELQKPFFTPPNWLFAPVWSLLYVMMTVAAWRVWRSTRDPMTRRRALWVWAAQLTVNLVWSCTFFGLTSPILGLLVIAVLVALILWTIRLFARLDRPAAWLMIPYLAWVAYATALNLAIVALN